MTKSRIAFVLWLAVWLGMLFVGFGFYRSVVNQHVLGYPSSGQFDLCIVYPGFWAALNAILIALSRKTPLLVKALGVVVQVPAAFAFFFVASGGGVIKEHRRRSDMVDEAKVRPAADICASDPQRTSAAGCDSDQRCMPEQ
jgi:hypothetical protein